MPTSPCDRSRGTLSPRSEPLRPQALGVAPRPAAPPRSRDTPRASAPRPCARASSRGDQERSRACPTSARRARPRGRWRGRARRGRPRAPAAPVSDQATRSTPASPESSAESRSGKSIAGEDDGLSPPRLERRERDLRQGRARTRRARAAAARPAPRRRRARRRTGTARGGPARPESRAAPATAAAVAYASSTSATIRAIAARTRLLVPALLGDRLEVLGPVEHQASRRMRIAFRSSSRIRSIRRSSSSGGSCSAWM